MFKAFSLLIPFLSLILSFKALAQGQEDTIYSHMSHNLDEAFNRLQQQKMEIRNFDYMNDEKDPYAKAVNTLNEFKELAQEYSEKLKFRFRFPAGQSGHAYLTRASFPADPCSMVVESLTYYGSVKSQPLLKRASVDFKELPYSPEIQPIEKQGLYKNAISFGHAHAYFPNNYRPKQMEEIANKYKELYVICGKIKYIESALQRLQKELKASCDGQQAMTIFNQHQSKFDEMLSLMKEINFLDREITDEDEYLYEIPLNE